MTRLNSLLIALILSTPLALLAGGQKVFIAVDGLSYNALKISQTKGLFKEFKHVGAHVAPFPSMTDLSWAEILKTTEVFGNEGRIKSVEATYFDESTQSIQGDPRDYYRRLAAPKYYLNAFDCYFNPFVEGLMYFPTEEIPKKEIRTVIDEILSKKEKPYVTAYIGAIDSIAHTQKDRLFPVLKELSNNLTRLFVEAKKDKRDIEVILVSDHGNVGRFYEFSGPEEELIPVDLFAAINSTGLNAVNQLIKNNDVAVPLMALGTWAPVYLKNRRNIDGLINGLSMYPWFDLAVYLNKNNANESLITIKSKNEWAQLHFNKITETYTYYAKNGNPLKIPNTHLNKPLALNLLLNITANTPYPDSIYRIVESASQRNFDFPDVILTLKDGYYVKGPLGEFTKMYRTHGSLTKASSLGILASSSKEVPGWIRSNQILDYVGLNPNVLFGEISRLHHLKSTDALRENLKNQSKGIETKSRDFSTKRIFQHLARFIADTRVYFVISEIKTILSAFKFNILNQKNDDQTVEITPASFDVSKIDFENTLSPEEIGSLTDAVIQNPNFENLLKDPRVLSIKQKLTQNKILVASDTTSDENFLESMRAYVIAGKRTTMKIYQLPYLLDQALTIPEKQFLPETRDLKFAQYWLSYQNKFSANPKARLTQANQELVTQKLFKEIFKEKQIEEYIYPTPLRLNYKSTSPSNPKSGTNNTTIVYLPGIYNGIFDQEIFKLGVQALRDDMGLRVLIAPSFSACSSDVNGQFLLNFLKEDQQTQIARGQAPNKYILLGYSKGGVDALNAFVLDPSFTSKNILALATIASPLHGSSILDKTDLPFELVNILTEELTPEICRSEKTASKSITESAMTRFWRKNEKSLIGLTRYFTLSFRSEPENSHLFMKATKLIAQFDEDNDGVVTLSSSKLPDSLGAVDLGIIEADHLAGIASSRFPQKAFLKAVVESLLQFNVVNDEVNYKWNYEHILSEASWKNRMQEGVFGTSKKQDLLELNYRLFPRVSDPADNYEPQVKLPSNQLKFDPYISLDVSNLAGVLSLLKVVPVSPELFPKGINIEYKHQNAVQFRIDHQFNYESRSPGGLDDNKNFGYTSVDFNNEPNWALLKSNNNSIRLTTLSYRFNPTEFSKLNLKLAVTKGVNGANPIKGHTGKDDSAFQLWLTIREKVTNGDRSLLSEKTDNVFLFGYYWGDPIPGFNSKPGDIYENWYSNKSVVIATLPESKQLLLNDQSMLGKVQIFNRNLVEDLKRAFPNKKAEDMEIIAITIQHDSNDCKDSSEAYFKYLRFEP